MVIGFDLWSSFVIAAASFLTPLAAPEAISFLLVQCSLATLSARLYAYLLASPSAAIPIAFHQVISASRVTIDGVSAEDFPVQIVDFVRRWSEKTEIGTGRFVEWLDITVSKFYDWRERYGKVNEHNGWVPRDFWLERQSRRRQAA